MNNFQERLQDLLIENELSRLQLAKRIGISSETINGYFNDNFYPKLSVAVKISKYFNCSLDYLMGLSEEYENHDKNNLSFIDTLKKLLKANHLSPEKLMKKLNLGETNYYRWQRGENIPSITSLTLIAQYFDVSIDYLVYEYKNNLL